MVRELPSVSFVHVEPAMRHRITTTFDGRSISALTVIEFELYNEGSEHIQNAALTVTLPAGTSVLQAHLYPRDSGPKCAVGEDNLINVLLPYMNPFRDHKQLLRLMILADGETRPTQIKGSGEGWSVRYSPLSVGVKRKTVILWAGAGLVFGLALGGYLTRLAILRGSLPAFALRIALASMVLAGASLSWSIYRTFIRQRGTED